MDLLTEAKLERRFRSGSIDLNRLYSGYYIVELLRSLTEENDPHPELFDLAQNSIVAIDEQVTSREEIRMELLRFELESLRILGHFPMLTQCVGCGRERRTNNRVSFGLNAGGLLCQTCRAGQTNVISVSSEGFNLLSRLADKQLAVSRPASAEMKTMMVKEPTLQVHPQPADPAEHRQNAGREPTREIRKLMEKYIAHLLGFSPRMHRFLDKY